jgi:Domain of unknown function (DUF4276)
VRFILFLEGHTEQSGIARFLKRYLDPPRLKERVAITCVRFAGWSEMVKDLGQLAYLHLNDPKYRDQTIGLVALLDLYGPSFYPSHVETASQRVSWAKAHFEKKVKHPKFRMFFAVHEVEAWFLSDLSLFPSELRKALSRKVKKPESVNFDTPPKALLKRLYREKLKREYKQVTQGIEFFAQLDPKAASAMCPYLKAMLDDMVSMAEGAGF